MTVLKIFEKVNAARPIAQRVFFGHLNDTQTELIDSYGQAYVLRIGAKPLIKYAAFEDFPDIADPGEFYMAIDTGMIYAAKTPPYTEYAEVFGELESLDDEIMIDKAYHPAIVDNILFLSGAGEIYKAEFLRKAESAFKRLWNIKFRGKSLKRFGW